MGTDHGAGLDWLVVDDEAMAYALRIARGMDVDEETLAYDVIADVGCTGDFLSEDHTVRHFRHELFAPSARWTREPYERWRQAGQRGMGERAADRVAEILATHVPAPLDADLDREVEEIVLAAAAALVP